jgi:hypothetical protein
MGPRVDRVPGIAADRPTQRYTSALNLEILFSLNQTP